MDSIKFARLVREFPFLTKIVTELKLSIASIGSVDVKRGDRNLLEVKPSAWSHDAGEYDDHCGHRFFWVIAPGESIRLDGTWCRAIPYHRFDQKDALPIGLQLLYFDRDVQFIVEIYEEHWGWEDKTPNITIYKMQGFDWHSFCRPVA